VVLVQREAQALPDLRYPAYTFHVEDAHGSLARLIFSAVLKYGSLKAAHAFEIAKDDFNNLEILFDPEVDPNGPPTMLPSEKLKRHLPF